MLGILEETSHAAYQDVLNGFLEAAEAKNRPRTVKDYKRLLTSHGFGAEKLSSIKTRDIEEKLDKLGDRPGERAHARDALKNLFSYCIRRGFIETNPVDRIDRIPKAPSRSRVLTESQLVAVWGCVRGDAVIVRPRHQAGVTIRALREGRPLMYWLRAAYRKFRSAPLREGRLSPS